MPNPNRIPGLPPSMGMVGQVIPPTRSTRRVVGSHAPMHSPFVAKDPPKPKAPPAPPDAAACPLRPRGKGEKGVYWGGNRYYYDDGGEAVSRHQSPHVVGPGKHPAVAAREARDAENQAIYRQRAEASRLAAEQEELDAERARFAEEKAAFEAAKADADLAGELGV